MNTFVNFLIGTVKTVVIFTIIIAGPAVFASALCFNGEVYMNCMESPAYTALTTLCALFGTIGFFAYESEQKQN